jgi:hypothetical protein
VWVPVPLPWAARSLDRSGISRGQASEGSLACWRVSLPRTRVNKGLGMWLAPLFAYTLMKGELGHPKNAALR